MGLCRGLHDIEFPTQQSKPELTKQHTLVSYDLHVNYVNYNVEVSSVTKVCIGVSLQSCHHGTPVHLLAHI